MDAAFVTHGLKTMGGGTRMWVGIAVIAFFTAVIALWLNDPENRRRLGEGFFGVA